MQRDDLLKHNHSWLVSILRDYQVTIGRKSYTKQKPAPYKEIARALNCGDVAVVTGEDAAKKLATSIMHDGFDAKRQKGENNRYYVKKIKRIKTKQQELFSDGE